MARSCFGDVLLHKSKFDIYDDYLIFMEEFTKRLYNLGNSQHMREAQFMEWLC